MLLGMEDLRKTIGKNLSELRKRRGLTQIELAEKFAYTDRAVSKWENGDTLPDVEVLYNLCEFYGVTIDYLTHEDNARFKRKDNPLSLTNRILITTLVSSVVWMIATIVFVFSVLRNGVVLWRSFLWAVPINALVAQYFNRVYFHRKLVAFIFWTIFAWGLLAAVYLTLGDYTIWPIFILGVPVQASMVIWLNLKLPKSKEK